MSNPTADYSSYSLGPGLDELTTEFTDTPEKAEAYERELRITVMTRRLLMAIDQERERRGLTKADLATMIGVNPASIRRLFTSENANPTLRTVLMLMAALRIDLEINIQAEAKEETGHDRDTRPTVEDSARRDTERSPRRPRRKRAAA